MQNSIGANLTYQAKLTGSSLIGIAVVSLISLSFNAVVIALLLLGQTQLAESAAYPVQAQAWFIPLYALFVLTMLAYAVGLTLECWFFAKSHGEPEQAPSALDFKASLDRSTLNALKLYILIGKSVSRAK